MNRPLPFPGPLRRAAAGAWHVPAGFVFLFRHPTLLPMAVLPVLLMIVCLAGGLLLGAFLGPLVETRFGPAPGNESIWMGLYSMLLIAGTLAATVVLAVGVALILVSPILDRLSRRVEALVKGRAPEHEHGLGFEIMEALRGSFYFLAAAPGVFLLGLIPLLGPVLALLWAARALAFQLTDPALSRRGITFRGKREWHWRWLAESEGFGLAGMVTLLVPLANLLFVPALAVGGTLLVLDLEEVEAASAAAAPVAPQPLPS